jgi:uncharacterized Fe-S cluster protein YjdI
MARRIQHYESEQIAVTFDPNLCIHAARCIAGNPLVFDVRRRNWIDPEAGTADDIAAVIERCPSGALQYHRLDGVADEVAETETTVRPQPNGPLFLRGKLVLRDGAGAELAHGTRFALCRCGASANKPFCDNAHRAINFQAE